MSKLTSLFLIVIFLICLFIGIFLAEYIDPDNLETTPTPTLTPTIPPEIKIDPVLILGMTNFEDEQIFLESAWHATFSSNSRDDGYQINIDLFAIYPPSAGSMTDSNLTQYHIAHPPIVFPKAYLDNLDVREFIKTNPLLNQSDVFFEDVVVLDEYAMNYIIELTNTNPILPPTGSSFCNPWDDPQNCHDIQHHILETLCSPPQNILRYTNFIRVFDVVPNHLKSTLSQDRILSLWQLSTNLNTPPQISCDIFP
jgi:hypothetical protein